MFLLVERDEDRDRVFSVAVEEKMFMAMADDAGRHNVDDVAGREAWVDGLSRFDFQDVRKGVENVVVAVGEA